MTEQQHDHLDAGKRAYDVGDYETAVQAFRQAREVWRQVGDKYAEADALMSEGVAHLRMKNYQDAEAALREALAIFTEIGATDGQATALGNLGSLLYSRGRYEDAADYLDQAAVLFGQIGEVEREVESLQMLSRILLRKRDWINAVLVYDRLLQKIPPNELTPPQRLLRLLNKIFFRLLGVQTS
ncbi:MAG: tetratricopeptide repeat protein [Ardenticatenia bacterium]|nr:tetratricopeptide repeat protein [Ardenticatenia bacterium]